MKMFRREIRTDLRSAPAPTAEELAVVSRILEHGEEVHFGAPTRCPHCRTYGFVERLDLVAGVSENHCPSCDRRWTITQRAILEATAAAVEATPIRPIGNGILVQNFAA